MTALRFVHNADEVAALLDAKAKRQVPFATANGLNRTAEEIQSVTRKKIHSQLRIRSARAGRFLEQLIHIRPEDRARKDKLIVIVGIQAPSGKNFKGRADILAKFQTGGTRTRGAGDLPIPYPSDFLRPNPGAEIPRSMYPRALGLIERRAIEGGFTFKRLKQRKTKSGEIKTAIRGLRKTFALDPRFHTGAKAFGVWQREKGEGTQRLWLYVNVQRWPKRITFLEDGERMVKEQLPANVAGMLEAAQDELKQFRARKFEKVARVAGRL